MWLPVMRVLAQRFDVIPRTCGSRSPRNNPTPSARYCSAACPDRSHLALSVGTSRPSRRDKCDAGPVVSPEDAEEPAHDVHAMRRDAWINHQRILAAAIIAVHREGPRVPMATVAADAGVGVGTLYRRFPTRDALLDALTHRSFQLVLDNVRAAEAVEGTGLDCLDQFLDTTIDLRDELLLPLHGGPDVTDNPTRALRSQVHQTLQRIIERGQQDGSIRADATPPDIIIFGAALAQPPPKIPDWDHTARRLKRIYIDGLAARRPEQPPP